MLPRCTDDLPPLQGRGRVEPADTQMREELLADPDGGDHFWLLARLDGMGNRQAVAAIARAAGVDPSQVSHAGARDRHAVVQQWFAVPKAMVENPGQLPGAGYKRQMKVLQVREGQGPVTPAAIRAMAVRVRIRDAAAADGFARAEALLAQLRQNGLPNYFGMAAMGPQGSHARWGKVVARGGRLPRSVPSGRRDRQRYVRAWQARLFNTWLAHRMRSPGLQGLLSGDLVQTQCGGPAHQRGVALVASPDEYAPRVASWEVTVLGPLFGSGMEPASGLAAELEAEVLRQSDAEPNDIAGGRRWARVRPAAASVELVGKDIVISATLPVDTFAAVLVEELVHGDRHLL
ncbi:MAG: tRNA pseudouridine(13) synthase TruD [Planctomycetota bacterium]|nr:MAG: tRNA pseudouridine(13) synthase TruD [Planctomycetota bacterium]